MSMLDSLDAYAQAQIPRLGDARIHVAGDHDKDYQRCAKQSICGVAAWVTGVAKSISISISIPTGLLIFVEEALRPPGRLRDPGLCAVYLGMWAPRWESVLGKHRTPLLVLRVMSAIRVPAIESVSSSFRKG